MWQRLEITGWEAAKLKSKGIYLVTNNNQCTAFSPMSEVCMLIVVNSRLNANNKKKEQTKEVLYSWWKKKLLRSTNYIN